MTSWGIGARVATRYMLVTAVMLVLVLVSIWRIRETTEVTRRAISVRASTAETAVELQIGVNRSLAALRGWMLPGARAFDDQRARAREEIDAALKRTTRLSADWAEQAHANRPAAGHARDGAALPLRYRALEARDFRAV